MKISTDCKTNLLLSTDSFDGKWPRIWNTNGIWSLTWTVWALDWLVSKTFTKTFSSLL